MNLESLYNAKNSTPKPSWPEGRCCRSHPHEPEPGVCDGSVNHYIVALRDYARRLERWGSRGWATVEALTRRPVGCPNCAQAEAEVDRLKCEVDRLQSSTK